MLNLFSWVLFQMAMSWGHATAAMFRLHTARQVIGSAVMLMSLHCWSFTAMAEAGSTKVLGDRFRFPGCKLRGNQCNDRSSSPLRLQCFPCTNDHPATKGGGEHPS